MPRTRPIRVTAPVGLPVELDDLKRELRISFEDDDAQLTRHLNAAVAHLDGYAGILGRCLLTQTWSIDLGGWPFSPIRLPFPDVTAVAVEYIDPTETRVTVAVESTRLVESASGTELHFRSGFTAPTLSRVTERPVRLVMTAGYGGAAAVPSPLKQAILMQAAHWYDPANHSAAGVSPLITPYRMLRV